MKDRIVNQVAFAAVRMKTVAGFNAPAVVMADGFQTGNAGKKHFGSSAEAGKIVIEDAVYGNDELCLPDFAVQIDFSTV